MLYKHVDNVSDGNGEEFNDLVHYGAGWFGELYVMNLVNLYCFVFLMYDLIGWIELDPFQSNPNQGRWKYQLGWKNSLIVKGLVI
jgi:hypothetical protein